MSTDVADDDRLGRFEAELAALKRSNEPVNTLVVPGAFRRELQAQQESRRRQRCRQREIDQLKARNQASLDAPKHERRRAAVAAVEQRIAEAEQCVRQLQDERRELQYRPLDEWAGHDAAAMSTEHAA